MLLTVQIFTKLHESAAMLVILKLADGGTTLAITAYTRLLYAPDTSVTTCVAR